MSTAALTPTVVRVASERDVAAVLRVTLAAFEDYRAEVPDYGALRETEDDVAAWLAEGAILVAERDGAVVGAVRLASGEEGDWYIGRLAAQPGTPGGVGLRLMREAERLIRERDGRGIRLGVLASRQRLLHFYERLGYVRYDTVRPDDRPDHPGYHWCRKDLARVEGAGA